MINHNKNPTYFIETLYQKEKWDAVNQDIVKELEMKATQEEMNQDKEELNKKLNTLSKAIRSMQKLIKDLIYPETCGTSK